MTIFSGILGGFAVLAFAYYRVFVPWFRYYGVTEAEKKMAMPGDRYVPDPRWQNMRAITIDAPPSEVWKWLVQIGGYRAGWYSHTWAENLFGMGIYNKYELRPEWQSFEPGHKVVFNKLGHIMVAPDVVPQESLVMFTDTRAPYADPGEAYYASIDQTIQLREFNPFPASWEGYDVWCSWAFHLEALPDGKTRMISRTNADWASRSRLVDWVLLNAFDTPHGIMEVEMFRRLKACAEGRSSEYANTPLPPGGAH